ncbi:MAG: cytochrome c3 family protein [Chloroflexota bacterium]
MTKQQLRSLSIISLTAAIFMFMAVSSAFAQDEEPVASSEECIGCHEGLRANWEESPHAHALDNPAFQEKWEEEGNPSECLQCHTTGYDPATGEYAEGGVACLTCHSPVPDNHPDNMIPTNVSSEACGSCHVDTMSDLEHSAHGDANLDCSQCHNPHTTELRAEDSQTLCQSCHNEATHNYALAEHAEAGLLCTDCHLRVDTNAELGEGHAKSSHTFQVDLETCTGCHADAAHPETLMETVSGSAADDVACYPAQVLMETAPAVPVEAPDVAETPPSSVNPLVYILPAGIGLAFGMLIAPMISKSNGKRRNSDGGEK